MIRIAISQAAHRPNDASWQRQLRCGSRRQGRALYL